MKRANDKKARCGESNAAKGSAEEASKELKKDTVDAAKEVTEKTAEETGQEAFPPGSASSYLIASDEGVRSYQKELLYRVLEPVFFGKKRAENMGELIEFFRSCYGIDVCNDFCEGDDHYEEFLEAQQAIAEGMSIYSGTIGFEDSSLAKLAEQVWDRMEEQNKGKFRRINTFLEE